MNRNAQTRVEGGKAAALVAVLLGLFGPGLWACVEIDGGAAEFSWSIRSADGRASSCDLRLPNGGGDRPDIESVELCWEPAPDGTSPSLVCNRGRLAVFACSLSRGATDFVIDEGRTAFWIEPLCADGDPLQPDLVEVPAPIVRDVSKGEVVTLDALLIIADASGCLRSALGPGASAGTPQPR